MAADAVAATLPQPPEARLLLACARIVPTAEDERRIAQALDEGVDWPRLLGLAEAHGLLALLFRALQSDGLPSIPAGVETRLWTYVEQLRRKNRLMSAELHALLDLLEANGIPAVPFKGPVLAATLYGGLELREFGDLDLLLPPADIVRARSLLQERGYAPMFPLTPALDRALLASPRQYHVALKHQVMVELHWKSDAEFAVCDAGQPEWWAQRPSASFESRPVRSLQDRELVLVLLLHGSKHLWEQLNWVAEIAELLRQRPDVDWEWIFHTTELLRARCRVAVGLLLAQRWFDAELHSAVRQWLAGQEEAGELAEQIAGLWFARGAENPRNSFTRLFMNLNLQDSFGQRLRHVIDVVLRPGMAEWTAWPLPEALHFLFLPLRAFRLGAKYLRAIGRD